LRKSVTEPLTTRLSRISKAFEKVGASYVLLSPLAIDGDADRGVRAALDAFAK
jgi:hypothetical protein